MSTVHITKMNDIDQASKLKSLILEAVPFGVKKENVIIALARLQIDMTTLIRDDVGDVCADCSDTLSAEDVAVGETLCLDCGAKLLLDGSDLDGLEAKFTLG